VAAHYAHATGIPAFFHHRWFPILSHLHEQEEEGAKRIISENPDAVAQLDFPDGEWDIDTPEDAERLLSLPT
jgi:CTP:molybdopterin cytidylyltransferase MocA